MNARTLSQHYGQLTGEERLRLLLAARARGDRAEVLSLCSSCPKMEVIAPDPNFVRLVYGMHVEVCALIRHWVEVSHLVVRDRLLATVFEGDDDRVRKIQAQWRECSGLWKGMESAITCFCAQTDLTRE